MLLFRADVFMRLCDTSRCDGHYAFCASLLYVMDPRKLILCGILRCLLLGRLGIYPCYIYDVIK